MKKALALLLIAILLLCPLASAQADGGRIYAVEELMSADERAALETRAEEIYAQHGVAPYIFFDMSVSDLIPYTEQFVEEHVSEPEAIVLGLNSDYYYFLAKGETAKRVFTNTVCDEQVWPAFRAVKNDPAGKFRAYLDAVDSVLAESLPLATVPAVASGSRYLTDNAGFLRSEETDVLLARLARVSTSHSCDVAVLTVATLDGADAQSYSDEFFAENLGPDGILLLVALAERQYCVSTYGSVIPLFSEDPLNQISEDIQPLLSKSMYMDAFLCFAEDCNTILGGDPIETPVPTPVPTPLPPMTGTKSGKPTVVDSVGLLSASEVTALSARLAEIGEKYQCDVLVAVVPTLGNKTAEEYADDFFDYNGYGYGAVPDANGMTVNGDGVLLLLSMEDRDFAVSTSGFGIKAFTDYGIQTDLEAAFLPYLRNDNWYGAFNAYADRCDWLLNTARKGKPYDVGYYLNGVAVAIAAIAGLLLAFIPVNSMKRQLTDVHASTNADTYLTPQTFLMTQNTDLLLGSHTSRTVHVEPVRTSGGGGGGFSGGSSTHTSSSGGTHGGHSGKF